MAEEIRSIKRTQAYLLVAFSAVALRDVNVFNGLGMLLVLITIIVDIFLVIESFK